VLPLPIFKKLTRVVIDTHYLNVLEIMSNYEATGIAEGWIEADSEDQVIEAWQHLHDTRLAYSLQGWFGRTARDLIKQGIINE
jgi:Leu/Phe-tRNA-protein transferase